MGSASLKANEPSMEEILASIRRIISDEQETTGELEAETMAPSPLKTVLDITERHISPILFPETRAAGLGLEDEGTPSGYAFQADHSISPLTNDCETELPAFQPTMVSRPPARRGPVQSQDVAHDAPLLSIETDASVAQAFDRLTVTAVPSQAQTVEDLMKEMLRPMLKAWLDDNLPSLVERLVQAEIERVTRGRV